MQKDVIPQMNLNYFLHAQNAYRIAIGQRQKNRYSPENAFMHLLSLYLIYRLNIATTVPLTPPKPPPTSIIVLTG